MTAVETTEARAPAKGTKLRRLYDQFMLGHPVSKARIVLIFGKSGPAQNAIYVLRDQYGLDIRNISPGMWQSFGRTP